MNLVEQAKAKAAAAAKAEQDERDAKDRLYERLQKEVDAMVKLTVKGLKQFHNVETKQGTLKLITGKSAKTQYGFQTYKDDARIAVLKLDRSKMHMGEVTLLWVEGEIISGTYDASDDCRDIPYTDANVSIFNDWKWDSQNHLTDSARMGRFMEGCSSTEKVDAMLQKVADFLAPLFK